MRSASGTANGSRSSFVRYSPCCALIGARVTVRFCTDADASARRNASSTRPRIEASSLLSVAAKPHAPLCTTRKPIPRSAGPVADSTAPSWPLTASCSRSTVRASAYVAPREAATVTRSAIRGSREGTPESLREGGLSMMTRVDATAYSRLSPAQLFDLLADPRGCMTWHGHAEKDRPQGTDAPPGLALVGAEYWTRGLCGKIPWRARTMVTTADPSRQYATESETIFSHPRVPNVRSGEGFLLEGGGAGVDGR